jgi:hypothetical protein
MINNVLALLVMTTGLSQNNSNSDGKFTLLHYVTLFYYQELLHYQHNSIFLKIVILSVLVIIRLVLLFPTPRNVCAILYTADTK